MRTKSTLSYVTTGDYLVNFKLGKRVPSGLNLYCVLYYRIIRYALKMQEAEMKPGLENPFKTALFC